jgi:hypothetical protein
MAIPNSSEPYFLSFLEWSHIQNVKKERRITEIESLLVIQNSKEDDIFNTIIKKLIRINIFDLSRISYLVILFLSPYIDPHLKEILNYDEDVSTSILNRIYENEKHDYLPPLDKTIGNIINLVLNQLINLELFLNINILILYLNLHNRYKTRAKTDSRITLNNKFLFKISQLVEIITNKIPNSTLSLLIMKTINKLGKIHNNYFDTNIMANLEKEYLDSKMTEITNNSRKNNELLDDFIVRMISVFDSVSESVENTASVGSNDGNETDNFIIIWNTCRTHMVGVVRNGIQLFKIGLDILILHLVKEQPDLKSKASCICNSIMNFLEMEVDLLDTRISI